MKVSGNSMIDYNIDPGDLVAVKQTTFNCINNIILAEIEGEQTVKFLEKKKGFFYLIPGNIDYPVIKITEEYSFRILGVVVSIVKMR